MVETEHLSVSIVIVNFFSHRLIVELLQSIHIVDYSKIVVVDNSNDITEWAGLTTALSDFPVDTISMSSNVGFGAAVNEGVRSLNLDQDDFLWILNPDTIPTRNAGLDLARFMVASDFDLASPVLMTGEESESVWFSGGYFDHNFGRTVHSVKVQDLDSSHSFLTAAAMMMRRRNWDKLVGFREDLFMYWEDADLCIRAQSLGFRLGVASDVIVWHAVGATSSSSGRSRLFHYYMQRNRIIVLRELFGTRYLCGWKRIAESLKLLRRAAIENDGRLGKVHHSLKGIRDGILDRRGSL
ncbi:glycosyltransferase family 2 protein [Rhodococcus globerulus]|uniref:Glycosyltransferase family 2 protein n=1 Tax=Rhodococcus globerulus TaxID=33008 RepID=A0ABU4BQT3_RHOGO|nr:glycosyltransferase family 2 protein [Rhodococcus globerulus]MDV6266539.1 glycosyltransferase family 2 protein [Rhodococcus globerulus]